MRGEKGGRDVIGSRESQISYGNLNDSRGSLPDGRQARISKEAKLLRNSGLVGYWVIKVSDVKELEM